MELQQIPYNQVVAVWPKVERFLAAALEHSAGEYDLDQLRAILTGGRQLLLVLVENGEVHGAVTIAIESYPNMAVAFVTGVGGEGIARRENFEQLFTWCRGNGFTHIRGAAYEAVARLWHRFGAREIYRMVEIQL